MVTERGRNPDERAEEIGVLRTLLERDEPAPPPVPEGEPAIVTTPEASRRRSVADLVGELQSPDKGRRRAILRSLLEREPDMASAAAAASVLQDADPGIRSLALRVLEEAPHLAPIDALAEAARDEESVLRARALILLGRTGNPSVVDVLHDHVVSDADDEVVGAALTGLSHLSASSGPLRMDGPALDRVVASAPALAPAEQFRFVRVLRDLATALPESEIQARLLSSDPGIRAGAAMLALEGGSDALLESLAAAVHDEDPDVRRVALVARVRLEGRAGEAAGEPVAEDIEGGLGDEAAAEQLKALRPLGEAVPRDASASVEPEGEPQAAPEREEAAFARVEVPEWLRGEIEDASPEELAGSARRLVGLERPDLLPPVAEALARHPADRLRAAAPALRDVAEWDPILRSWRGHPDPERRAAALRLAAILAPEGSEASVRGLLDSSAAMRLAAIEMADHIDGLLAEALLRVAREDAFPHVRRAAVLAFRPADRPRRLEVAEALVDHADPEARMGAADLLAGGSADEAILLSRLVLDRDPEVAARAADLLVARPSSEVAMVVWAALRLAPVGTRGRLVEVLTRLDGPMLGALAGQAVEASVGSERAIGIRLIGALEGYGAFDRLLEALADPERDVRLAALQALADLPSPTAVDALAGRLRDPDVAVRLAATRALAGVEDDRAVPALVEAAADAADEVRDEASRAIQERRSASVARILVEALEDPGTRRAAAGLLAAMKDIAADFLLEALEVEDDDTRSAIGDALRIGEAEVWLTEVLGDRRPEVRRRALLGLKAMRAAGAVPAVIERLQDPDPRVRALAPSTLGELGDRRAEEPLKQAFVSDPDMDVVAAIEPALRQLLAQEVQEG